MCTVACKLAGVTAAFVVVLFWLEGECLTLGMAKPCVLGSMPCYGSLRGDTVHGGAAVTSCGAGTT